MVILLVHPFPLLQRTTSVIHHVHTGKPEAVARAATRTLTHGVAVEQKEAVRGSPFLHGQVEGMGSIEVGVLLKR